MSGWEKRNEGVYDLELGKYKFRWCLPEKTVRNMGWMIAAGGVGTEEQATDAVRWFLRGRIAEGDDAQTALEALGGWWQVSAENEKPLCIQPMTHGDSRFAEGLRAGLLEASEYVKALRAEVPTSTRRGAMCDALAWAADSLLVKAGEP